MLRGVRELLREVVEWLDRLEKVDLTCRNRGGNISEEEVSVRLHLRADVLLALANTLAVFLETAQRDLEGWRLLRMMIKERNYTSPYVRSYLRLIKAIDNLP